MVVLYFFEETLLLLYHHLSKDFEITWLFHTKILSRIFTWPPFVVLFFKIFLYPILIYSFFSLIFSSNAVFYFYHTISFNKLKYNIFYKTFFYVNFFLWTKFLSNNCSAQHTLFNPCHYLCILFPIKHKHNLILLLHMKDTWNSSIFWMHQVHSTNFQNQQISYFIDTPLMI